MLALCRPAGVLSSRSQGPSDGLTRATRVPPYFGISLCWYPIPLAYSYDDLIEFVRFRILSSVTGGVRRSPGALFSFVSDFRLDFLCAWGSFSPALIPFHSPFAFYDWRRTYSTPLSPPPFFFLFSRSEFTSLRPWIYPLFSFSWMTGLRATSLG